MGDQPGCLCSICQPALVRDQIAAAVYAHELAEDDPTYWRCVCGVISDSLKDGYLPHHHHVADAVVKVLNTGDR